MNYIPCCYTGARKNQEVIARNIELKEASPSPPHSRVGMSSCIFNDHASHCHKNVDHLHTHMSKDNNISFIFVHVV